MGFTEFLIKVVFIFFEKFGIIFFNFLDFWFNVSLIFVKPDEFENFVKILSDEIVSN